MNQTIDVNITPGAIEPVLHLSQGDKGRALTINIVSDEDYSIPSGASVNLRGTKPSGLGFDIPCTVSGNVVTAIANYTMTEEPGCFPAELRITSGDTVIGSANLYVSIEHNPHGGDVIDGTMAELDTRIILEADGTNTTELWWAYFNALHAEGDNTRYDILSRFARALAGAWREKTYTLRSYNASVSGSPVMTPLDDLAGKSPAQLCTDATTPTDDWADEDPMTWYIRANALSLADGTMNIIAFEGEGDFDISGESAPVYTFAIALWIREYSDGTYNYISFRTTRDAEYYPEPGDVAPDNAKRYITWHPTFGGGLNKNGNLTSGAGIAPYIYASANAGIVAARKWNNYEGLWNDCDTKWLLHMWQLRHFNLENSGILEGCTSYGLQYTVALAESGVKRVLVTTAQGAGLVNGSCVIVGDPGANTNYDRGQAYMRNISDCTKIKSIENVTINGTEYTALNLDISENIDTTATTKVSTMPWFSGSTEQVPGHKDGSVSSLTNGKTPMRVAGVEVLDGAYVIGLDPLYRISANAEETYFDYKIFECRDSEKLAGSITSNYIDTGITIEHIKQGWNYIISFLITIMGILFPTALGGSSTTFYKSAFLGTYSAGVRCPWRFAALNNGGPAGLGCESGHYAPSYAVWSGRPRLCGSGKKRGEWAA